ncbi:MAG TPA: hypothetical protein VF546_20355 [Pyrinomonadaceae bacterium]|jgi:hypothetical protein
MLTSRPRALFASLCLLLCALLPAACGGGRATAPAVNSSVAPAANADAAAAGKIKFKTPDDQTVVEFKPQGDAFKIEFSDGGQAKVLRSALNDKGKRKYELEGGGQVAEVKPGDDGFKVRTTDGRLLWKVKTAADKIKISDNEENQNPYELVRKEDDRVKIKRNEAELGEVKFYRDRQKVKVKDAAERELFDANTDNYSAAYGVLLLEQIPAQERYIIMAELLARKL